MENGNEGAFAMLDNNGIFTQYGLTKREYFAGLALQGIISKHGVQTDISDFAKDAIKLADQLLKQLNTK
jgi:hypothetical protein